MNKKALILDLDNTIYPVPSIADKLFKKLFEIIDASGEYSGDIALIKAEIMRTPFQKVANSFSFSPRLFSQCMSHLENFTYNDPIKPFEDYLEVRQFPITKFLVTVGFFKLQQSKIRQMDIEADFEEIFIVDPVNSSLTKKDIFQKIIEEMHYLPSDLLVVGDDLNSEIKAAIDCGIDAVLYNSHRIVVSSADYKVITNFKELKRILDI